ncbi:tyrosine-type recombinase/integrase [Undibacterium sp. JH2W]|uniref:tyrosine-type recombinase/integrase n=1 Tax=Undibacterium sp. JH2W TaxID=3413037 RepID=UPI003BF2AF28
MAKIKFTSGRVDAFTCEPGKKQSFLWDSTAPGLGLRVTASGAKAYIFQAKLDGEAMRITIGDPKIWEISAAQSEARRLKVIVDNGQDPRHLKEAAKAAEQAQRAAKEAEEENKKAREIRESITLGEVWPKYVQDRKQQWSELHLRDHLRVMHAGGEVRKRSKELTRPGPLASLGQFRLVDLTVERIDTWAKQEANVRATSARLALRLLKACLFWCAAHPQYGPVIISNSAQSRKARESLGKPKVKHDVLQREQLKSWFSEVQKIENRVISVYLQALLLTGARREELAVLKWTDVDFQWKSIKLSDKVEDFRMVPLTPYVSNLLKGLPRRSEWVFSSPTAESGHITDPSIAHRKACKSAGLFVTLHGLRRSFATLSEWTETPAGIAAQVQGHAPQGVREQNYIRRPLDLLRMWHVKIEEWMLAQAQIDFALEDC